jgi:peptidylprolyl isomerase
LTIRAHLLPFASTALLGGCVDRLTAPECVPMPFAQASVSADTITTTSGLRYIEGQPGTGIQADWCRALVVHFTGALLDGTVFESTRDIGQPIVFVPGRTALINGLEQGVIGMRTGGTRRLIIPPELAFGSEGRRNQAGEVVVPPNSPVVYDVVVLEISP